MLFMAKLVLLFTVVPLVELWLLLAIGRAIGFWPTVGIAVVTAFLGAALAKREGRRVLSSWSESLAAGRVPDEGITGGVLVLLGAALLITPGVLTDVTGLLLLFPPTRRRIAAAVQAWLQRRAIAGATEAASGAGSGFQFRVIQFGGPMPGAWSPEEPPPRRRRGDVIDVRPEDVVVEEVGGPGRRAGSAGPGAPDVDERPPPRLLP